MMAAAFARGKNYGQMYEQLHAAADAARAFDRRPDDSRDASLLLGEIRQKKSDYETTDSRTLCRIMREKWLADEAFDGVRESREFAELIRGL